MWNWKNNLVLDNPSYPYSRFIASWTKMCRRMKVPVYFTDNFKDWMRSIGVPEDDIHDICEMADNGRLELEDSASLYIKEHMIDKN